MSNADYAPPFEDDPGYLASMGIDIGPNPACVRAKDLLRRAVTPNTEDRTAIRQELSSATADFAVLAKSEPGAWESFLVQLSAIQGFGALARDLRRAVKAAKREAETVVPAIVEQPSIQEKNWPLEGVALERLTDLGNARRFVLAVGRDVRWCAPFPFDGWLTWTGSRWAHDETGAAMRLAKRIPRFIRAEAPRALREAAERAGGDAKAGRKAYAEWTEHADHSESATRLQAILIVARTEPEIVVARDRFDVNPLRFNTPTGTVYLDTGVVYPCARGDLLMHEAGTGYNPSATCPRWEAFVLQIMDGDVEMVAYLQRIAGYCLLGELREPAFFIFWGSGRNGKGTFVERLRKVLGTYAANTPTSTFVDRKDGSIPNDLAALAGKRLVTLSESEEGERLEESLVKQLTGGDPITARFMRGEFFEFKPVCKPILSTNDKPAIRGIGPALRARLHLVPFTVSFEGREDFTLGKSLDEESSGILNWCLQGLDMYLHGDETAPEGWRRKPGLHKPQKVNDAVTEYMAEMDLLGRFLAERVKVLSPIERENRAGANNTDLYASFKEWCLDGGERPRSQRWLTMELKSRNFEQSRDGARNWPGLELVVSARPPKEWKK